MTRVLFAALCLALALPEGVAAQAQGAPPATNWVTLRPPGQGFRILMPQNWEQAPLSPRNPDTKLIIRVSGGGSPAVCTVHWHTESGTRNRTQASLNAQLSRPLSRSEALALIEELSSPQILENSIIRLGDIPAYLFVGRGLMPSGSINTSVFVVAMQPGRMWSASCMLLTHRDADVNAAWTSWRPLLMEIVGSLALE